VLFCGVRNTPKGPRINAIRINCEHRVIKRSRVGGLRVKTGKVDEILACFADVPTQYVEANGIRFAYRRFGNAHAGYPLVFNQHYLGTMDYWDPAVTDGLARNREVILFDNAGISSSSGDVPTTVDGMGANAIAFVKALDLEKVDVLGFSIGGMVAQEIAVQAPELVRRLILVGTGLRGGVGMAPMTEEAARIFGVSYDPPEDLWLRGAFRTVAIEPGRRPRVFEAQATSSNWPRPRGKRKRRSPAGRGAGKVRCPI
jgi:pimeloyl-ACP methyl ester carboxylesterase